MSVEGNKRLMHRFFEAMNKGNLAVWDELCAPGYVYPKITKKLLTLVPVK